jgi:uncharacterized membrane protein YhhN
MTSSSRSPQNPFPTLVFVATAAIYLASIPFKPYPASFLVKAFPVVFLAVRVWRQAPGMSERLVAVGLGFSAVGDILLDLNDRLFFAGLGAFLVGHLFFSAGFLPRMEVTSRKLAAALVLVLYGAALNALLFSKVGFSVPVALYGTVLTLMGILATVRRASPGWVMAGALIFVISDSLIAINRFVAPFGASKWAVMITYYIAQYFIAEGVLREQRRLERAVLTGLSK